MHLWVATALVLPALSFCFVEHLVKLPAGTVSRAAKRVDTTLMVRIQDGIVLYVSNATAKHLQTQRHAFSLSLIR